MIPGIRPLYSLCRREPASICRHILALVLCAVAGAQASGLHAEELQPLESIERAAMVFLEQQHAGAPTPPRVTVGRIDPRLRLSLCGTAPEAFIPPGQKVVGTTTVGVRCEAPSPWTVYVQATVALMQPVLVLRRPLPRGTVLGAADVDMVEKDVARLTIGYLTDLKDVDGMVLRRSVSAGAVLHPGLVQHPVSIRRGERVTILGQIGGIEVRMEGQALADGAKGDIIQVRNLSSGRAIEGVVVGPGVVQVRL
jgi:flagella basal body P-ring formation protein FlgA